MVYLQTYKLCILTLLCKSTVHAVKSTWKLSRHNVQSSITTKKLLVLWKSEIEGNAWITKWTLLASGSIVIVYLQTYKLCILTLLCKSTVLWLSPFGNFGYILFIFLTYYLGN
jgi:hypothetical protein